MTTITKTCIHHGKLEQKNIYISPHGYLACKICGNESKKRVRDLKTSDIVKNREEKQKIADNFIGPMPITKTCEKHGILAFKDIGMNRAKNYACGFKLYCRICRSKNAIIEKEKKSEYAIRFSSESIIICSVCKIDKLFTDYTPSGLSQRYVKCRTCVSKQSQRNEEKRRPFNHGKGLKQKYRVTEDQYRAILKEQNYVCRICKKPETAKIKNGISLLGKTIKPLSMDHDHEAEKKGMMIIRGIVCHNCNVLIGWAKDNANNLRAIADYLEAEPVLCFPIVKK